MRSFKTAIIFILLIPFVLPIFALSVGLFDGILSRHGQLPDTPGKVWNAESNEPTAATSAALAALKQSLDGRTAGKLEVQRQTKSLHVAVVSPGDDRAQRVAGSAFPYRWPISLRDLSTAAGLIVANEPIEWIVGASKAKLWGRIAFEGRGPFDIRSAEQDRPGFLATTYSRYGETTGILAGFRMAAFGAVGTTRPADVSPNAEVSERRRFCRAMAQWLEYFDVQGEDVSVRWFGELKPLVLTDAGFDYADGERERRTFLPEICSELGRYRQSDRR